MGVSPRRFLVSRCCDEANWADPIEERLAIDEPSPVTPMTALVIDADGRLTYMGEDGCRRQIVGDSALLDRLRRLREQDSHDRNDGVQS